MPQRRGQNRPTDEHQPGFMRYSADPQDTTELALRNCRAVFTNCLAAATGDGAGNGRSLTYLAFVRLLQLFLLVVNISEPPEKPPDRRTSAKISDTL
jgi:hypothetical protein